MDFCGESVQRVRIVKEKVNMALIDKEGVDSNENDLLKISVKKEVDNVEEEQMFDFSHLLENEVDSCNVKDPLDISIKSEMKVEKVEERIKDQLVIQVDYGGTDNARNVNCCSDNLKKESRIIEDIPVLNCWDRYTNVIKNQSKNCGSHKSSLYQFQKIVLREPVCSVIDGTESGTGSGISINAIRLKLGEKMGIPFELSKKEVSEMKCDVGKSLKPTISEKKTFLCDVCKKSFTQSRHLKRHNRIHTGEKPYDCDICQKPFTLLETLKVHKRTHTGEKPYVCDICQKTFTQLGNLKAHKNTHTGEKPYVCNVCLKSFSHLGNLNAHFRTHTGEKRNVCDVCQKSFTQLVTLKKHKQTHTGEKPFVCDVCQKPFSQLDHLKIHKRIHTGEKPFVCVVCQKSFSRLDGLSQHKRTHTEGNEVMYVKSNVSN